VPALLAPPALPPSPDEAFEHAKVVTAQANSNALEFLTARSTIEREYTGHAKASRHSSSHISASGLNAD